MSEAIIENDFRSRGVELGTNEIFISDGSKCDTGNFQEIFGLDNVIAVTDPVYPVYVDTNVMAGRTGAPAEHGRYGGIVYMPCTAENNFVPELPTEPVDMIYLCYPNNPTGAVASKAELKKWVDFARENKAIILFDAAYEAFISDPDIPHSIYEIDGAKEVAVEFRSFSKTAGFTGTRCAFTVVPKDLKAYKANGETADVNAIWNRRHCTKFNGVSYVTQVGAAAVYSDEGQKADQRNHRDVYEQCGGYSQVARRAWLRGIRRRKRSVRMVQGTQRHGFMGVLRCAAEQGKYRRHPGAGFGASGEGYFRLSAFNDPEVVKEAMARFAKL